MTEVLKTLRLAFYVLALPLVITAVVSAESLFTVSDGIIDDSEFEVQETNTSVALDTIQSQLNHVLNIDESGGVSGQIMSRADSGFRGAAGMDVSLNFQGNMMASSTTGDDGTFRFENVAPGPYSFIATSPDNITTFGVYIYEADAAPAANKVQFSVAATNSNVPNVREILNSEITSVSYSYVPSASELLAANETSQFDQAADGSITGRVAPLLWDARGQSYDLTGNQVYLINDAGVVASASVDASGEYRLTDVEPGYYDFVSFGPHGAAAMSIEVVAHDPVADNNRLTKFASARLTPRLQDGVVLSEPTSGPSVVVDVEVSLPQQMGGFAGGGYGGGGGGAAGGIGDWGGILGFALAAWAISSIDDNRNNVLQQPVVLPPVVIPPPTSPF